MTGADREEPESGASIALPQGGWQQWFGAAEPYVVVRFLMLRLLGIVYTTAFLVAALQGPALVGEHGLLPATTFLERVESHLGATEAFLRIPTLFWIDSSDTAFLAIAWTGVALSLALVAGVTNAALQAGLWLLYISIVHVGQRFYGYGWESQLLETGFLSIFLCPLKTWTPFASKPPFLAILLARWLVFRIMLGAGLIKIRGDDCWRDLTCLVYHYETQPIPNALSAYFHAMPGWFHRSGVAFNHYVELVAPFLALSPRPARLVAATSFVVFQAILISSGNLSFLNWLTLVPALACFDDRFAARSLPKLLRERWATAVDPSLAHHRTAIGYGVVVALLSLNPVSNLVSSRQAMNASFDPIHLVNTYGAFGSVTRVRREVILQGSSEATLDADTEWKDYELPCKPGDVARRPCWISPYHLRLDWQMWFAGFNPPGREHWILHLVQKLLAGDHSVDPLLAHDPFPTSPPVWVRAEMYQYELLPPTSPRGAFWSRTHVGSYLPPIRIDDPALLEMMRHYGWIVDPTLEKARSTP